MCILVRWILLVFILTSFSGCYKTENVLQGSWMIYTTPAVAPIESLHFYGDSVEIVYYGMFLEKAAFQIVEDSLILDFNGVSEKLSLLLIHDDTVRIGDSFYFYRRSASYPGPNFQPYDLAGISTDDILTPSSDGSSIHAYKTGDGKLKIRLNDAEKTPADIPDFLCYSCSKLRPRQRPQVQLFLGKGMTAGDLKTIYYQLHLCPVGKVTLVLNKRGLYDFEVFADDPGIFFDTTAMAPPQPGVPANKELYEKTGGTITYVNGVEDFAKIYQPTPPKSQLVVISGNMQLEDYLKLKTLVREARKSRKIFTIIE